mgnify:CR=1 FL=1
MSHRVKGIPFIPTSVNFSSLPDGMEDSFLADDQDLGAEIDKEIMLLKAISSLKSDKEKCVLLFEIIRELGYQVDYNSIAVALNVKLRWFMRVKAGMHKKVREITTND